MRGPGVGPCRPLPTTALPPSSRRGPEPSSWAAHSTQSSQPPALCPHAWTWPGPYRALFTEVAVALSALAAGRQHFPVGSGATLRSPGVGGFSPLLPLSWAGPTRMSPGEGEAGQGLALHRPDFEGPHVSFGHLGGARRRF